MEILLPVFTIGFLVWWNVFRNKETRENMKWDVGLNSEIKCSECLAWIPREARKCMHCGSAVQNQLTDLEMTKCRHCSYLFPLVQLPYTDYCIKCKGLLRNEADVEMYKCQNCSKLTPARREQCHYCSANRRKLP
jgi:hypothetical protein